MILFLKVPKCWKAQTPKLDSLYLDLKLSLLVNNIEAQALRRELWELFVFLLLQNPTGLDVGSSLH